MCMCDLGHLRVRVCGPRCHSGSSLYIYRVYLRHSFGLFHDSSGRNADKTITSR